MTKDKLCKSCEHYQKLLGMTHCSLKSDYVSPLGTCVYHNSKLSLTDILTNSASKHVHFCPECNEYVCCWYDCSDIRLDYEGVRVSVPWRCDNCSGKGHKDKLIEDICAAAYRIYKTELQGKFDPLEVAVLCKEASKEFRKIIQEMDV